MDFLTGFPYWGIVLLTVINALLVYRMDITIEDSDQEVKH